MNHRKDYIMRALEYLQRVKSECKDMEMGRAVYQIQQAIELIHNALDIFPSDKAIAEIIEVSREDKINAAS